MSILSFQTAVRLKEAGFPQPKYDVGQFWYNSTENLCVITHGGEYQTGFTVINGLRESWILEEESRDGYFAPTATDILEQLPGQIIGLARTHWFCCNEFDKETAFFSDNPHEAAAAAWLELNKKQDEQ